MLQYLAADHSMIVTMEENVKSGGFGEKVLEYYNETGADVQVLQIALPDDYIEHGNVDVLKQETCIDAESDLQADRGTVSGVKEFSMKERLDVLLVSQGLAASREKAKAIIMSGNVLVNGQREDKAGTMIDVKAEITVKGGQLKYVSRGGLKLEKAMSHFDLTLEGRVCMDVGASTGGFTDCMLQNGAVKVYSVDVGHGQLDWKLRNDPRVVCMEKTNIRYVTPEQIRGAGSLCLD